MGDYVWVIKPNWPTDRPDRKLTNACEGPFLITDMRGSSYVLQLPDHIRVHPVFHAEKLRKARHSPMLGQQWQEPPPVEVDGDLEWNVEKVIKSRIHYGKLQYKVQWTGYDEDPVFYPASNFRNALLAVKAFHDAYPSEPRPPKRLQAWLDAALKDVSPEAHADDDYAKNDRQRRILQRRPR